MPGHDMTALPEGSPDLPHAVEKCAFNHHIGATSLAVENCRQEEQALRLILSFDVEEHYRIEAAVGLQIDAGLKEHYRKRLDVSTGWLLDQLAERNTRATFFIVGKIAQHNPGLVRAIHNAGHEVASHSWSHKRLHTLTPEVFRDDVRRSKDALEQVTGDEVVGYRAPTFSIVHETAWAVDILAELGFRYDSSIFPVWHDRYGVPQAPRMPFLVRGREHALLEIPPATLRLLGNNLPIGGGGYFRLLPLFLMKYAFRQARKFAHTPVAMLYFHPWEFDPLQARLPLRSLSSWRTYVGLRKSQNRLTRLLDRNQFVRAEHVASSLQTHAASLPVFHLAGPNGS